MIGDIQFHDWQPRMVMGRGAIVVCRHCGAVQIPPGDTMACPGSYRIDHPLGDMPYSVRLSNTSATLKADPHG